MANFDFLIFKPEYRLFSAACIEAEKIYHTSPALCAIGCRKALELGVKWVYYRDYKAEVNQYILTHKNDTVIYKLTHNIPLTMEDFSELERVLTKELGSSSDYQKNYPDTPFGILVRTIAGMDHAAVQEVFADFINSQGLNPQQIAFVDRVIVYIEKNGYIKETEDLIKPPFDTPANLFQLFSGEKLSRLLTLINGVKDNAERHMA